MKLSGILQSYRSRAEKNIVVFGAGRSGTTWLAQIIASAGLELIFEPLNASEVAEAKVINRHPLFCRKHEAFEWQEIISRMMRGEVRNSWTIRDNEGAERKVVKFIRANLLAEWIIKNYDVHPVFIIRNPLAVVASIIEQGWEISAEWVKSVLRSPRLNGPFFSAIPEVSNWVSRDLSEAEVRALYWCIHNYVPQQMGLFRKLHFVRYEELAENPEDVFGRLAPKIGIEMTEAVRAAFSRPSFMHGKRHSTTGYDPKTAWRDTLTSADAEAVKAIIGAFGMTAYIDET